MDIKPSIRHLAILCVALVTVLGLSGTAHLQEKPQLLPLEPVPDVLVVPGHAEKPAVGARVNYNGRGRVDRIATNEIVINDTLRPMSDKARFFSASGRSISIKNISLGAWVGYKTDAKHRIVEIHLLDD